MDATRASVSRWLVTSENPPRQIDGLDYERCAALHNYIVEHGWIGSGKSSNEMPRRTWFDTHGGEAEVEDLHSSVVEFLKQALDVSHDMALFYWVSHLSLPEQLWEDHIPDLAEEGEESRFFTLYPMNVGFGGHPDGLNYDQHDFKAIMQQDIADDERTRREDGHSPPWQHLETILSAWIDMIYSGKIQAMPKGGIKAEDNEVYHPWVCLRFSQAQLRDTVTAYDDLVKAIESRMNVTTTDLEENQRPPLIEEHILDVANVPKDCFARAFLTKARRPKFINNIAPGISLPDPGNFTSQNVFPTITDKFYPKTIPPIRIFNASGHLTTSPFDLPYEILNLVPCGLYIPNADLTRDTIEEASARLVLPFTLGSNGLARRSDTSRFCNEVDLYQPGFSAFSGDWTTCVRMIRVFKSWRRNVESGEWRIGAEGVMDAIEKFGDGDTERWNMYYLEPDW